MAYFRWELKQARRARRREAFFGFEETGGDEHFHLRTVVIMSRSPPITRDARPCWLHEQRHGLKLTGPRGVLFRRSLYRSYSHNDLDKEFRGRYN